MEGRLWLAARLRQLQEQREKSLAGGSIVASQQEPPFPEWRPLCGVAGRCTEAALPCENEVPPSGSAWLRKADQSQTSSDCERQLTSAGEQTAAAGNQGSTGSQRWQAVSPMASAQCWSQMLLRLRRLQQE